MGLFSTLFGGVVSFFTPPTVSIGQNMLGMDSSDMGMDMMMPELEFPAMEIPQMEIEMYEGPDSIFDSSDSIFGSDSGFGSDSFSSDSFGSSF